jgi:DNA-binding MarR family transcriptional regulator
VHAAILAALSDFGPLAQYELADRLDIQRSHLVGYVDLLEQRELVQRERDALALLTRGLGGDDRGRREAVV